MKTGLFPNRSMNNEYVRMATAVRMANLNPPNSRQPRMNRGMLPIKTINPMGQPVKLLMICDMPLTPPEANLAGMKNNRRLTAWIRLEKMISK